MADLGVQTHHARAAQPAVSYWILAAVLALALLIRVPLLFGRLAYGPEITAVGDEWNYHERACNLLYQGTYSASDHAPYLPDAIRPPGFPAFIAAVYAATGPRPLVPLILVNLLNIATVGLVVWMAARMWDPRIGLAAGVLLALDVNHALSGAELLTESLGTTGAIVATWVALSGFRNNRPVFLVGAGVLWGLTALTRPTFVWVAGPLLVVAAVHYWPRRREMARSAGLLLAGMALAVGPWLVRNQMLFGSPAICLEIGETMYEWNGGVLVGHLTGQSPDEARAQLEAGLAPRLGDEERCQAENDRIKRREAVKLFAAHPAAVVRLQLTGMAKFFLAPNRERLARMLPEGGIWGKLWMSAALLWYVTLALGAVGLRGMWRQDRTAVVFFVLLALYAATLGSMQGQGRFRVPVDPFICIVAGAGAVGAWRAWRRRSAGR